MAEKEAKLEVKNGEVKIEEKDWRAIFALAYLFVILIFALAMIYTDNYTLKDALLILIGNLAVIMGSYFRKPEKYR